MKKLVFTLASLTVFVLPVVASAQSVDILWQGNGYTPPFYQGRTLWSNQSQITLFAVPQGLGKPSSLNYKWIKNGTVLGDLSGVGKNTLSLNDTVLSKPLDIEMQIVSNDDEVLADTSTTVTPITPSLLTYENNPLYGFLFHQDVDGNYKLTDPEVTFAAFPLFFNGGRTDGSVTYNWQTNDGGSEDKDAVIFRVPAGESGSSAISVSATSQSKLLQTAGRSFLVQFGNNGQ